MRARLRSLEDAGRHARVVRLLRVQRERADVPDAELACAEPLPADQRGEVVLEGPDVRARLAEPKRRLEDHGDARGGHGRVVGSGARGHVNVRIEELHAVLLARSRT
jgi:hypothetical protein